MASLLTRFSKPFHHFHRIRKTFDHSFKTLGIDLTHSKSNRKSKPTIQQSQQQQPLLQIEEALKGVFVLSDTFNAKLIDELSQDVYKFDYILEEKDWCNYTNDPAILNIVCNGLKLEIRN